MQDEKVGVEMEMVDDEKPAGPAGSDDEKENEDSDSDDISENEEAVYDGWDSMPSGSKLGVMGIDFAPGHSAKCWVCNETGKDVNIAKIVKGSPRLWYRHKDGQAEKITHEGCLTNCSFLKAATHINKEHIKHSVSFLTRNRHNDAFHNDLKEVMQRVLDKFQPLVGQEIATILANM